MRERDVDALAEVLSLTRSQHETVRRLRDGEAAEFEVVARRFVELEAAMGAAERGSDDRRAKAVMRDRALAELLNKRLEGAREFRRDVRSVLTAEQAERWGRAERLLRRDLMVGLVGGGFSAWAQQDLVDITRGLGLTEEEKVRMADVLEAYQVELDRPLRERAQRVESEQAATAEGLRESSPADALWYDENAADIAEVNRRYTRKLADALGGERGVLLTKTVHRGAYRYVYAGFERPAALLLERAEKLEALTPDQALKLAEVRREYDRESDRLHRTLIEALDLVEEEYLKFRRLPAEVQRAHMEAEDFPGRREWVEAERARADLEKTVAARVRALLTREQRARVER